ncbi:YceI family protein, partial [Roseomonas sp. DSM 102946]|nr:YceI family protein [Roseomonas sp. DSM 102946]
AGGDSGDMRRRVLAGLLLPLLLLPATPALPQGAPAMNRDPMAIRAGRYRLDSAHGRITWAVNHFGLSIYRGQITGVEAQLVLDPANIARTALDVTVRVDGLRTGDADLDRHLRTADFFDLSRFPTAHFVAEKVERTGERGARVHGRLTLHGVTKPVTLRVTFNAAGVHPVSKRYTLGFDGKATIRRSEFGMTGYLPAVGDEVSLELEGEFQLQE